MSTKQQPQEEKPPQFDDVLKRMLSAPPQHKTKAKPADKPGLKQPK